MKFTDLLQEIGSPIAFYPDLVPLVGSHESAIFLCQVTYWTGKQYNKDGWIYKTQEEWFLETGLTQKQQKTARRLLVERGYIEERKRGIPQRLEYRVMTSALNEVWDIWMIAATLKKQFKALMGTHGVLLSRGIQNEEIQRQMERFRNVVRRCHVVANNFFRKCRELDISPLSIIDGFRQNLSRLAQTFDKSILSTQDIHTDPTQSSSGGQSGNNYPPGQDIPCQVLQTSPPPSNPVKPSVPALSKITPKTSTESSPESGQAEPENTHTWGPPFKNLEEEDIAKEVRFEVLHDTQQEQGGKESNSQGQDCIFMKVNLPGGGGGENFDKMPVWVYQLQEKVRLGHKLERSELLSLAEHTLGDYTSLYRESGQVLNVGADDIKTDFLKFVQWYSFNGNPDINYVLCSIKKAERNPEQWDVLLSWLQIWEEVQKDPKSLETILASKVSSQGKRCNSQDLAMSNRLSLEKSLTMENWWDE